MDIELVHDGVPITILDGDYVENGKPTPIAVEHYKNVIAKLDNLRRFAAKNLLHKYNSTWVDEEIGPLNEQGFIERLSNPSIELYNEIGYIIVHFDDSGLFAEHDIRVTVDNGVPTQATI